MNRANEVAKTGPKGPGALSLSCKAAIRLQSEAMDRPLDFWERLGLRVHLAICLWCRRYGKQINFLHAAAHSHPDALAESQPGRLSPAAKERMKQKLRSPPAAPEA